jgi:hypothetical protein
MSSYDRRSRTGNLDNAIPYYVETSLQEGYAIIHKGLLAWTPLPVASERYAIHCLLY